MEMERNVKHKTSLSVSPDNVSMQQLSGVSSPIVYDRRHDPVIDDPFVAQDAAGPQHSNVRTG